MTDLSGVKIVDEAAALIASSECVCEGMGYVRFRVPLGHPLFGKAIPCPCKQDAIKRVRGLALQRRSGLSQNARGRYTFASFRPAFSVVPDGMDAAEVHQAMAAAKQACENWAATPSGWLVLSGGWGSGKTHLAIAVAGRQLDAARPVYYGTAREMLDLLGGGYRDGNYETYVRDLRQVAVLVVDEMGGERGTEWTEEQLFGVLNWRHQERKATMLCTNATTGDSTISGRLVSRMREGVARADGFVKEIVLPAGDCRPKVGWRPRPQE